MAPPSNPASQLSAPPTNGCLPKQDGVQFCVMIQCGRLAANAVSGNKYLAMTPSSIDHAYATQRGQVVLLHLSAIMYSYWDAAPAGPSVFELASNHLPSDLRQIFREQCASWGTHRLNAPFDEQMYVVEDGEHGSIVADYNMTKFYRVLGMKISPAAALRRRGMELPVASCFTALPFRGHLVYDGLIFGGPNAILSKAKKRTLIERCRAAKSAGTIISGFEVQPSPQRIPVSEACIQSMNRSQLREFVRQRGGSVSDIAEKSDLVSQALSLSNKPAQSEGKHAGANKPERTREQQAQVDRLKKLDKVTGLTLFRRLGYTEATNRGHVVTVLNGTSLSGSFHSKDLVPTATEIMDELLKRAESKGSVSKTIAIDDKQTAEAVNLVTKPAGIHTGFYPPPSVEEQTFSIMMSGAV